MKSIVADRREISEINLGAQGGRKKEEEGLVGNGAGKAYKHCSLFSPWLNNLYIRRCAPRATRRRPSSERNRTQRRSVASRTSASPRRCRWSPTRRSWRNWARNSGRASRRGDVEGATVLYCIFLRLFIRGKNIRNKANKKSSIPYWIFEETQQHAPFKCSNHTLNPQSNSQSLAARGNKEATCTWGSSSWMGRRRK